MKLTDLPSAHRPREKMFVRGADGVTDVELLAILLRTGYRGHNALELAKSLLHQRTLAALVALPTSELAKMKGIGHSRAAVLSAALAIGQRVTQPLAQPTLTTPEQVVSLAHSIAPLQQEHLVVYFLNARYQLIAQETISIGILNAALIHAREIFAPAITYRAASIVLVHNHPSGNPEPSAEDLDITEKIVEIGFLLDIPVLDHIIVAKDGWLSFKLQKLL